MTMGIKNPGKLTNPCSVAAASHRTEVLKGTKRE